MHARFWSFPAVAVALLASDLEAQRGNAARGPLLPTRRVVDGVERLRHDSAAFARAPQLGIAALPVAVMGGTEGGSEFDLTYAWDVHLLSDGRLATYAAIGSRFLVFGPTGRGERTIGRQGQGPGEFMRGSLVRAARDTLLMIDDGNARLNWVLAGRGVVSDQSMPATAVSRMGRGVGVLPGGRIVMSGAGHHVPLRAGAQRTEAPIGVIDLASGTDREVARVADLELVPFETRYRGRRMNNPMPRRLAAQAVVAVWDTLIATTGPAGASIERRSAAGRLVSTVEFQIRSRLVTKKMRDAVMADGLSRLRGQGTEAMVDPSESERIIREAPFADSLAYFAGFFAGPDATLWIVDAVAPGDTAWSATALRPDGAITGRLTASGGGLPVAFGTDRVVVRRTNVDGVVSMSVHRIVPVPVPVPQPAGAGTLIGIVVDTGGRRLDDVYVYAPTENRSTRTADGGVFRLNGLPEGPQLQVGFRRIGYEPQLLYIRIAKGGGALRVALTPVPQALPKVVTEARRTGIGGVVSDSLLRPLAGVRVEAVPSGAGAAVTDARGVFQINAKPGRYILTVSLKGHETRTISVTIPEREGREVAVSMRPIGDRGRYAREAWALENMRSRMLLKWGPFNKLHTREDLAKLANVDLRQLAQMSTAARVDEQCEASIDGDGMDRAPLWSFNVAELEMVEVYGSPIMKPGSRAPRGITSLSGARGISTQPQSKAPTLNQNLKCPQVVVWTRK